MQNIKKLKSKSIEGLEVKNYQTFPSMEWGEDGGLQADIFFKGKFLARVLQEGNGGCAIAYMQTQDEKELSEFKQACFDFLSRNDKDFGTNSQYEWMRNKTPEKIDGDDLEMVVNLLKERHDHIKVGEKAAKNNYGRIAIIDMNYQYKYYFVGAFTTKESFIKAVNDKNITNDNTTLHTILELQQAF